MLHHARFPFDRGRCVGEPRGKTSAGKFLREGQRGVSLFEPRLLSQRDSIVPRGEYACAMNIPTFGLLFCLRSSR